MKTKRRSTTRMRSWFARNICAMVIALSVLAEVAIFACAVRAAEKGRPNILLVISDDQSWPHCGAYGDHLARTPAFDRIAREGVLFTHAFCPASQCGPSRAAIVTGRNIWQLEEAGTQASLFPAKFKVYPDLLEAAGYHVGYTGKPCAPGNWTAGGRRQNAAGRPFNSKSLKPPTSEVSDIDYAANFADFLQAGPPGAPFCFWFGCIEPHRDYEKDSAVRAGWDPSQVQVPPYLPDNEIVRRDLLDYYLEIAWFDQQLAKMIDLLEQRGQMENTLIIVTSDNGMPFPRSKATLYESGTRVPLAIQWPAKIPGGRVVDNLVSFIDLAPTIYEAADIKPPAEMTGRSLLSWLESERAGRSDAERDYVLLGKERHNHARADNVGYPQRAIRSRQNLYILNFKPDRWPMGDPPNFFCHTKMKNPTKDFILANATEDTARHCYQLTFAKRPEEELYDIHSDPHCLQNLAADAAYSDIKRTLKSKLIELLHEQRDPRVLGLGDVFDSYPYYGRMQPVIPGFKEEGRYNPAFWPFKDKPLPTPTG